MPSLKQMASPIGGLLKERGQTVSVSESATGGLISAALLSLPGASTYFVGGATVYTQIARRGILRFNDAQVQMQGSTEQYATLAAATIREILGTDWAIGESGAAGPGGNRYGNPAGYVALAVVGPSSATRVLQTDNDDREKNMWIFAQFALELLYDTVRES
ncbi:MAG: Nicotinamide-nucleotide amidohydrolase PncC [Alphaproteobacteria bacterium MarineAlpha11_Bin1]|nr:MAG: Nicotinamide-nucleotide amidohydrolase PncC [Alphaproteobacteria bacterium MarineAlpha11_Bin1]|tara:strand:- start:39545 stop:40027 length:483 start_codon:yes stop_codon:yes gene_type:complete